MITSGWSTDIIFSMRQSMRGMFEFALWRQKRKKRVEICSLAAHLMVNLYINSGAVPCLLEGEQGQRGSGGLQWQGVGCVCEQSRWAQGSFVKMSLPLWQLDSFKKGRCWPFPPLCRDNEPRRLWGELGLGSALRGMFRLNKQFWTMSTFCPPWHSLIPAPSLYKVWKLSCTASRKGVFIIYTILNERSEKSTFLVRSKNKKCCFFDIPSPRIELKRSEKTEFQ